MSARSKAGWWVAGVAGSALVIPLGCNEPHDIVPVGPPGTQPVRVPVGPQNEAQAIGESGPSAPLPKSTPKPDLTNAPKSPPTPVNQPTKTASGLEYVTLKEGTGPEAQPGQVVEMHYVGTLADGTKFDSSRDRGETFKVPIGIGKVVRGWDEGVPGMKVGEVRKLTIPPDLGYGAQGAGGKIPGNATLVFEVELMGVQ